MNDDQQPPAWATTLLQRITIMEQQINNSPLVNIDPNVVLRAPGADFTPSSNMLEEFPYIQDDLFKRPLEENDRRRFLFDCPKNTLRNYDPPKLNKVQLNSSHKQFDASLSTIQYRLSGITRPMDWFAYQLLHANWDPATLKQQARDFTYAVHELISDLASHITTLRTDNMFRGLPNGLEPPAPSTEKFLIDTQDMLDHIKLQQSVQNATQKQRNKRNNGPRSKRFNNNSDETHFSSTRSNSGFGNSSNNQPTNNYGQSSTYSDQVGGRLASFSSSWSSLLGFSVHPWLLRLLHQGYSIPLTSPPPLRFCNPSPFDTDNSLTTQTIDQEIQKLLSKQAIELVQNPHQPTGFHSNLFVIPKKDGGLRPVLNLKPLNRYLPIQHFKMETMTTITNLLQPGDYLTSIDLKDAFHHILIHKQFRHLLRFQWKQQTYQYRVLPFGLSLSPLIFTKVLKPVLKWARRKGIRITAYLDDMLIMGKTFQQTQVYTQQVCKKMTELGWLLNFSKSSLTPSQSITHLGMNINSQTMVISVPGKKIRSIRRMAYSLLKQTTVSWTHLARFIGTTMATQMGNAQARFRTRHLLTQLNQSRHRSTSAITAQMQKELLWWITELKKWNGRHLISTLPITQIFTDASDMGYGFVWGNNSFQGTWSPIERQLHINQKELLVIQKVFQYIPIPPNHHIQLCIDNTSAIAYIKHFGGTKSSSLNQIALDIWKFCFRNCIQLSTLYVPSKLNPADAPSRAIQNQIEWSLPQHTFQWLDKLWGPHHIDLFASHKNHLLQHFVSWNYHPEAIWTNAFSRPWHLMPGRLYLAPPWNLILQTLQTLLRHRLPATLITPNWPTAPWYPLALQLASRSPLTLEIPTTAENDQDSSLFKKNKKWTLLAWNLH
jgi:hypothetical protein